MSTLVILAALLGSTASMITAILALVIYLQGRRAATLGLKNHGLLNSLTEQRIATAQDTSFKAGVTEGRLSKLENHGKVTPQ